MGKRVNIQTNEEGFVLVTGLIILLVLTMLGISATTNTSIELQIAANDRIHKETFYQAEAGAILGSEVLEQNFNCDIGFTSHGTLANPSPPPASLNFANIEGYLRTREQPDIFGNPNGLAFWRNPQAREWDSSTNSWVEFRDLFDPADADVSYPIANLDPDGDGDPSDDLPETGYIYMGGYTEMLPGGALQMAAGYEGKGKGSAAGGVAKIIDIYSRFRGALNSETIILLGWRHLVGSEGGCKY